MHDALSKNPKDDGFLAGNSDEDERTKILREYLDAAKSCVKDGVGSSGCSKLQALKASAALAGVDPLFIEAAEECISGSEEACAKFAVVTAATDACASITAGAASAGCAAAMPVVVDLVWPIVGPISTGVVKGVKTLIGGLGGMFISLGKQILDLLGLGSDDTTEVDFNVLAKQYRDKDNSILLDAKTEMVNHLEHAWEELRASTGLGPTAFMVDPKGQNRNARLALEKALDLELQKQPLWYDRLTYDVEYWSSPPGSWGASSLKSKSYISLGAHEQSNWTPGNLDVLGDKLSAPHDKLGVFQTVPKGASGVMSQRVEGMQRAFQATLGWVVASVSNEAGGTEKIKTLMQQRQQAEGSGLTWLLLLGLGAAYGGYKWYKKSAPK
jgi:hypothetical protein